jgi:asparagine synthase (glutamine-hydrolysing)
MSAIAGVFGPAAESSGTVVRDMLSAMRHRASGTPEVFNSSGAAIGAAQHDWEATVSGWSGPLIAQDDDWVVAADATLYYIADLRRNLRTAPREANSAQLLLEALRMWGHRFARYVEGDYAIVAFERRRRRVLLARDFGGRRNLAYARTGQSLIVASSANAVVLHPQVSADYDDAYIAAAAVGAPAHGPRTAFRHVAVVAGGSTLAFEEGRVTEVDQWTPPPFAPGWEPLPSREADEELRALLIEATRQRLDADNPTTVFMSGGWDSTSVFASARASLMGDPGGAQRVIPVSISYPADDIGHEDHWIRDIGELWNAPIHWIDSEQVPLMHDSERRARLRDDPLFTAFEGQLRELARASRTVGSRVALDGFGGDHLFSVGSASVIADHLFYGRWSMLLRSWKTWPLSLRQFARASLLPLMSPGVREWIGTVRGKPLEGYWNEPPAPWIVANPRFAAELEPEFEQLPGEGAAEYESRIRLCTAVLARSLMLNHALGLDEGVQIRGPLFDTRLISFAAARPLSDRDAGGDSKRILRRSMAGLLPDSVLAPRTHKTGTPIGYVKRQLQASLAPELKKYFRGKRSHLERLGVLNPEVLLAAADQYHRDGIHLLGALLALTLETERWLAVREGQG